MSREINYEFDFENGSKWVYALRFDQAHRFIPTISGETKEWTKLSFHQCPNCPLKESESPQCPVARNLNQVVEDSKQTLSCTKALVTVKAKERTYSRQCATQEGLRSLFGMVMASSGCPHLDWLRPLARFHLPFADADETLFRVLSLQLLKQFFTDQNASLGSCAKDIQKHYDEIQKVNHTFIERIRAYCQADADKNAIAALDVYVQLFPYQEQANFSSLRQYF